MSRDTDARSHWQRIGKNAGEILNVRAEINKESSPQAMLIEQVGNVMARPSFLLSLLALHLIWIALNLPLWPWRPWDPYPFMFLATVASLESPFIALLVLMHQHRERIIDELREETSLQVSLHSERELAVALRLLRELQEKQGIETGEDPKLIEEMQEELDPERLLKNLRDDLARSEADGGTGT